MLRSKTATDVLKELTDAAEKRNIFVRGYIAGSVEDGSERVLLSSYCFEPGQMGEYIENADEFCREIGGVGVNKMHSNPMAWYDEVEIGTEEVRVTIQFRLYYA